MYLNDNQNHIELEIKTSFQHNSTTSTMFHQNSQQQLNSHHNSIIMKTHGINSSTTHLITTTAAVNHEFIELSNFSTINSKSKPNFSDYQNQTTTTMLNPISEL
jgi:hypothetical protein